MEFANNKIKIPFFIFVTILVAIIPTTQGNIVGNNTVKQHEHDEWFQRKLAEAYNASLQAYHHEPTEVMDEFNYHVHRSLEGTNSTRRGLGRYRGACKAQNPIDRCWRCKANWAQDRKRLADCVKGFGRRTTGGKDGPYYVVTDPADDNVVNPRPGTLRFGVLQPGPLWITFARDMRIVLTGELLVTSDKTIDGRGAQVRIADGAGITIQFANNVIIHNIKIHDIKPALGGLIRDTHDHVGIRGADDGDGINVFASTNIWLDHLSMWNCRDGLIDIVKGSTAITLSNNHFTRHDHVLLFGASDTDPKDEIMQISLAFNHFGKELVQRMPRCRYGFFHVLNNDYTHWIMYAIGGTSHPTIISQGNRFIAPPNPTAKMITNRNNVVGEEWKKWIWRSENDVFLNGAYFVESGHPLDQRRFKKDFIKSKPGTYVRRLTRFAGQRRCIVGKSC
ncbi:pectate lyase-like [Chenopodium quinoa]|uniref:Pectate lyase n=1 Tax=Chenopodium quinoa TaxID=63459 RepID=A0A803ML26_CHEQI|nr:pectate lyase-like [Chenopodium quinoa]